MTAAPLTPLIDALLAGDKARSVAETHRLLAAGTSKREIITNGLERAMTAMDAKCTLEQFNLLEIMLVGRALTGVVNTLYPEDTPPSQSRGTAVIASLEGDVHDIGKTIVKMVLTSKGFRVIDCGKDCPVEKLIDVAEREKAEAILISGLITSVIPQVRSVRDALHRRGLPAIKVLAGGAALKQASAAELNVDFVGQTAFDCLHFLEESGGGSHE